MRLCNPPLLLMILFNIQDAAEQKMRMAISKLENGSYAFEDQMDAGSRVQVAIEIAGEQAIVDFSGTDPVLPTNLKPLFFKSALMVSLRGVLAGAFL